MTTFETLTKHETRYGNSNFVQVARKVAKDDQGSHEFIALTRGYLDGQGSRRYKNNLPLPTDPDVVRFAVASLAQVAGLSPTEVAAAVEDAYEDMDEEVPS